MATSSPQALTVRAEKGETLRGMASRLFQDERAAELLAMANPGMPRDTPIAEGRPVRMPDKAMAAQWASARGITLGFDPSRPSGTRQKRAWSKFQVGPSARPAASVSVGPEAPLVGVLAAAGPATQGPGALTAVALKDEAALPDLLAERIHWLGTDAVLKSASVTSQEVLAKRAAEVATQLGKPALAPALVHGVHRALAVQLSGDVLKEVRRLVARAQQALAATASDPQGGLRLLASLRDAEADARVELLVALTVPREQARSVSATLNHLPEVRSVLLQAAMQSGAARMKILGDLVLPNATPAALAPRLSPTTTPAQAEELAVEALGLHVHAQRAHAGANAVNQLILSAAGILRGNLDGATALANFPAARAVVYRARGISLDPWAFPPRDAEPSNALEHAIAGAAESLAASARPVPQQLRVGWKSVEALGPTLAEVDASALGRGVGALLARVSTPTVAPADVKNMRAGDLMALSGVSATRAQVGTDHVRTLAPVMAALAVVDRFPFLAAPTNASQRLEMRRRVSDGARETYAVTAGLPMNAPSPAAVKSTLALLLDHAGTTRDLYPDTAARVSRARPLAQKDELCTALSTLIGSTRFKFRREEMSADAVLLCTAAWLLENARALPSPRDALEQLRRLLSEDGGRVLDAMERALLRRLDAPVAPAAARA